MKKPIIFFYTTSKVVDDHLKISLWIGHFSMKNCKTYSIDFSEHSADYNLYSS